MAFEGLSSRLQEITRKLSGKARISEGDLKEVLREGYRTRDINQKDCELCTTSKITQLIIDKIR